MHGYGLDVIPDLCRRPLSMLVDYLTSESPSVETIQFHQPGSKNHAQTERYSRFPIIMPVSYVKSSFLEHLPFVINWESD